MAMTLPRQVVIRVGMYLGAYSTRNVAGEQPEGKLPVFPYLEAFFPTQLRPDLVRTVTQRPSPRGEPSPCSLGTRRFRGGGGQPEEGNGSDNNGQEALN